MSEPREPGWLVVQSHRQSLGAASADQQGCWILMTRRCRSPGSLFRQGSWPIYQVSVVFRHSAAKNQMRQLRQTSALGNSSGSKGMAQSISSQREAHAHFSFSFQMDAEKLILWSTGILYPGQNSDLGHC